MSRIVSWFSCGAASAVATRMALDLWDGEGEFIIGVGLPDPEIVAVESVEPVLGADPDEAVAVLHHAVDGALR